MSGALLSPWEAMPVFTAQKTLTILLVGSAGVGKTALGEALAEYASQYTLEIRTCSSLPLRRDESRPRIDFVVFVASLTDRSSESFVRSALEEHVDFDFCFGRAALVATHADRVREFAVDPALVHSLAADIQSTAHLVSLHDRRQTVLLAAALVEQAAIAARHHGTSAPLARSLDAAAFTLTALPTM